MFVVIRNGRVSFRVVIYNRICHCGLMKIVHINL